VVFSNRERYVAIAVAAAVAIFGADRYLLTPYMARLDKARTDQEVASLKLDSQTKTLRQQRELRKVWSDMRSRGSLVPDAFQAEAQLMQALQALADETGVKVSGRKAEQPVREGDFYRTGVQFGGTGSTASISKFLWRLETAPLPIRVSELTLRSRQPNTDELIVTLNVSTLSIVPSADTPDQAGPGGGGRAMAPAGEPSPARGGQS
jgi:hypothetical protein